MEVSNPSINMSQITDITSNPFLFKCTKGSAELLNDAIVDGIDEVNLVITANTGAIPNTHPKSLKNAISAQVPNHAEIEVLKLSRQGKLFIHTRSAEAASQILNINNLFNIPVTVACQPECMTTRFLLHGIDPTVNCTDIAEELLYSGVTALEVRRFLKNNSVPTSTVLVTKLGTSLPSNVKLWYQFFRLSLFVDKPRQCKNCHKYTHNARSCKSNPICARCSDSHTGECTAVSPTCANCKGAHVATDASCPQYQQEACLLRFKSEKHLTFSEARRQFKTSTSVSYATIAAASPSPPPLINDYVTKADLQDSLTSFAESIAGMLQSLLDAQATALQNMINVVTTSVVGAIKEALTVDTPPLPSGSLGSNTGTATPRSLPPKVLERIEKLKRQKTSDASKADDAGSFSGMDFSTSDDKTVVEPAKQVLRPQSLSHVT